MSEDVSNVHQLIVENENIINIDNRVMRDMGSVGAFFWSKDLLFSDFSPWLSYERNSCTARVFLQNKGTVRGLGPETPMLKLASYM
jgi:hypothetical protein